MVITTTTSTVLPRARLAQFVSPVHVQTELALVRGPKSSPTCSNRLVGGATLSFVVHRAEQTSWNRVNSRSVAFRRPSPPLRLRFPQIVTLPKLTRRAIPVGSCGHHLLFDCGEMDRDVSAEND
ncbi:hypothetical protein L596_008211 [Steinernema carpocapsae]|uniref:Uncharacterized protein n=1 Tax=Steinernema carpocapsae TaxID=34508 RepID=A0A4U5PCB5_STECR|nr:hypothetical protein L596_008211 [Steinernema carpocapsae]